MGMAQLKAIKQQQPKDKNSNNFKTNTATTFRQKTATTFRQKTATTTLRQKQQQ